MRQYIDLARKTLELGMYKRNRTGVDHIGYHGDMCQYNLQRGFPAVTTKKLAFKSVVAEMLGFLRGYDNASDFRKLGCNVWDANANEDQQWLNNPNRVGEDDLGRVYGVQARDWKTNKLHFEACSDNDNCFAVGDYKIIDQLKNVVDDLSKGIDNRREIVTHWNPGELDQMALPPCHLLYQFGIQGEYLNLSMYQRSCDVPLGVPFNIAGYAWLLSVIAKITGFKPGVFTHFMHDIHVYEDQVPMLKEQLQREPYPLPTLLIHPEIRSLKDLETWASPEHFELKKYNHHPVINYPFAVQKEVTMPVHYCEDKKWWHVWQDRKTGCWCVEIGQEDQLLEAKYDFKSKFSSYTQKNKWLTKHDLREVFS